jgi:hypothetical protein
MPRIVQNIISVWQIFALPLLRFFGKWAWRFISYTMPIVWDFVRGAWKTPAGKTIISLTAIFLVWCVSMEVGGMLMFLWLVIVGTYLAFKRS